MTQPADNPQRQRIDALLAHSGWSRERLHEALGDSYVDYAPILNGEQRASLTDATFLAALLHVSVTEVLQGPRQATAIVCSDTGCEQWAF